MRNPSFTDYLIPTALDTARRRWLSFIEEPEPGAPFGAKGVGEPPTISSGAPWWPRHPGRDRARPAPASRSGPADIALAIDARRDRASRARPGLRIDRPGCWAGSTPWPRSAPIDGGRAGGVAPGADRRRRGRAATSWSSGWTTSACGSTSTSIGNIVGTWPADRIDPPVMIGSPTSTPSPPAVGTTATSACWPASRCSRPSSAPASSRNRPLAVAFFTNEEGARFAPDMLGSLVFAGGLALEEALDTVAIDGVRRSATSWSASATSGRCRARPGRRTPSSSCTSSRARSSRREGVTIGVVTGVQGHLVAASSP